MDKKILKQIKTGFYTAQYFNRTVKIIKQNLPNQTCVMQFTFFGKEKIKVCGINESVQLLKNSVDKNRWEKLEIYGVKDGDIVYPSTAVLIIKGHYQDFGIYENIIDGILARRSSVCNNCYQLLQIINQEKLIYMADRTDDYLLQPFDGYAAYIGGVRKFVTEASISLIKNKSDISLVGTMPHALIQQCNGDLTTAITLYKKTYKNSNCIALVDFHNDVISEINKIKDVHKDLFAIRIDTSKNLIDNSLPKKKENYGVCLNLVKLARKTLDVCGMSKTKIVISSGLNKQIIENFVKAKASIDFYGVGSSLITRNVHFTADLVMLNNKHLAKTGRKLFIDYGLISKTLFKYK